MLEFPTIAEANAYAASSGAAMVVANGTGAVVVYCLCDEVPENLRPHDPTEEPIYV